jgi:hypothetical protein
MAICAAVRDDAEDLDEAIDRRVAKPRSQARVR